VAKFFIDGVIDSGTGWLVDPDTEGDGREAFWPNVDRYRRAVRFFSERGFQCVAHATGDRGVREALDTYAAAGAAPGVRHRIEHIETLQPSDLPRFAVEGVARQLRWARIGRWPALIPGYGADVTVMADDPVEVAGDELVSLPVLLTVVDGEVVFRGL
jgi:predicted amidohydrolase YtcJ